MIAKHRALLGTGLASKVWKLLHEVYTVSMPVVLRCACRT